jgi:DNA gyrase subunit A
MIITKKGTMIRMGVDTLRVMGRATQGVRLISLRKEDEIASIAKVPASEEDKETDESVEGVNDSNELNNENPSSEE